MTKKFSVKDLIRLGISVRLDQIEEERQRLLAAFKHTPSKTRSKLHWTQRPANKAKLRRMLKRAAATRKGGRKGGTQ